MMEEVGYSVWYRITYLAMWALRASIHVASRMSLGAEGSGADDEGRKKNTRRDNLVMKSRGVLPICFLGVLDVGTFEAMALRK